MSQVLGILAVSFQGSRFGWGGFGSTLGAMLGFYLTMLIIALKLSIILFVVTVLELVEKSKLKKIVLPFLLLTIFHFFVGNAEFLRGP